MKTIQVRVLLTFLAAAAIPACCEDDVIFVNSGPSIGSGGGGQGGGFVPPDVPDVLFLSDRNTIGLPELFATNLAGTTIVNLSGSLAAGGRVLDFQWSPDRSRIAFKDGGTLHTSLPDGGGYVEVAPQLSSWVSWAPDSSRIAYIADQETDEVIELFTATPDGTDNDKVSGALVAGGAVVNFEWAPNSSRIVYRADQDVFGTIELYSCFPTGGGPVTQLSDPLVAGGNVADFSIAPMSDAVAYRADQETADEFQIYRSNLGSVPIPYRISGVLAPGGDVSFLPEFTWTDDGLTVIYAADQTTDSTGEVYAASAGGGGDVKISGLPLLNQAIYDMSVR